MEKLNASHSKGLKGLVTIQYKWKTIQTGCWDSLKGDNDPFIDITTH